MSLIRDIFAFGGLRDGDANPAFVQEDWGDILIWRFTEAPPGVQVVFTARPGGVSQPPYDSLNLGFHVGDLEESVRRNRELLASTLDIDSARVTSPRQRHTAIVDLLDDEGEVGSGAFSEDSSFDPCDGLVTALKDTPLLLHFADCAPVVLTATARDGKPVVAVLHAGRKGLAEGVVEAGVRLMANTFDISPKDIIAAVGPAIGACCYQVNEEIAAEMEGRFGPRVLARSDEGVWLDMQGATAAALVTAGLPRDSIHILDICTSCNDHFYSYRREGATGRHGAIAWIEGP